MNMLWRNNLMWMLSSHLRGKVLLIFTSFCKWNKSSCLLVTLRMLLLLSHTSSHLMMNLMFCLLLQLKNLSLHVFYMFSLLRLKTSYLSLKLRAYLLIPHSIHRFNPHSHQSSLAWITLDSTPHLMCLEIDFRTLVQN